MFSKQLVQALENLLRLINPSMDEASDQIEILHREIANFEEDWKYEYSHDGENIDDHSVLIWLNEILDGEPFYLVDWKDSETFVDHVDFLADRYNQEIKWGEQINDDFFEKSKISDLMKIATLELSKHGLDIYGFETGSDSYGGWIARQGKEKEFQEISEILGVRIEKGEKF